MYAKAVFPVCVLSYAMFMNVSGCYNIFYLNIDVGIHRLPTLKGDRSSVTIQGPNKQPTYYNVILYISISLQGRETSSCNTLFVLTARFGFRATPTVPFALLIKYIFCHSVIPSFVFKEVLGRYNSSRW